MKMEDPGWVEYVPVDELPEEGEQPTGAPPSTGQTVLISGSNAQAKVRNPWAVFGLGLITLGIYWVFWWYYINREMRDLGLARDVSGLGDNPGLSAAAFVLGWFALYIPVIWTIVTTTRRVQAAQRVTGQQVLKGWLAAVAWILTLGLGGPVFTQYQLNKAWSGEPVAPPALPGGAQPSA